jgi:hypothetical protein
MSWKAELALQNRFKIPSDMTSEEFSRSMEKQYMSLPPGKKKDIYQYETPTNDNTYDYPNPKTMTKSQIQSTTTLGTPKEMFPYPNHAFLIIK